MEFNKTNEGEINMKKFVYLGIATTLIVNSSIALAGDAAAGKTKSQACAGCHGMNGTSNNPMYPNLAGQKENYLEKAIKDYRDGKRNDPMMSSMVKGLSDADAADLAAFYTKQKP